MSGTEKVNRCKGSICNQLENNLHASLFTGKPDGDGNDNGEDNDDVSSSVEDDEGDDDDYVINAASITSGFLI